MDRRADHAASQKKQAYEAPKIREWGTVADLTKLGKTQNMGDVKAGSRFPPGDPDQ